MNKPEDSSPVAAPLVVPPEQPVAWLMEPNEKSHPKLKADVTFHRPHEREDWTITPLVRYQAGAASSLQRPVDEAPSASLSERAAQMLAAYAELIKTTGKYSEMHYIPEVEWVINELCTPPTASGTSHVSETDEHGGFTACDMTEAAVQGFRDGVASGQGEIDSLRSALTVILELANQRNAYFANDIAEAARAGDRDAYEGCREDLLDWKRRALKAEADLRKCNETCDNLTRALAEEVNGLTFMGEPVVHPQRTNESPSCFSACDMTEAAAQGFTDGQAAPELTDEQMPPLPMPRVPNTYLPRPECWTEGSYTAEQMREYGRAVLAAARPRPMTAHEIKDAGQLWRGMTEGKKDE